METPPTNTPEQEKKKYVILEIEDTETGQTTYEPVPVEGFEQKLKNLKDEGKKVKQYSQALEENMVADTLKGITS